MKSIFLKPVTTEKSVKADGEVWVLVHPDANKIEVKQYIKRYHGLDASVRMKKLPKKTRDARKFTMTKRKAQKIAIISVPKGKTLDLFKPQKPKKK